MTRKENKPTMKLLLKDKEQLKVTYLGRFSLPVRWPNDSESAKDGKWITGTVDPGNNT